MPPTSNALPSASPSVLSSLIRDDPETTYRGVFGTVLSEFGKDLPPEHKFKCDFMNNTCHEDLPEVVLTAFRSGLSPSIGSHYKYRFNNPEFRSFLCQSVSKRYGLSDLDDTDLYFTNGNFSGLRISLHAITNPKDEVIVPAPGWFCNRSIVNLTQGVPVPFKMQNQTETEPRHLEDMYSIIDAIGPNTKAIIFNNPHNPTGKVYSRAWLREFSQRLTEINLKRGRPVFVIEDAAYCDYIYKDRNEEPYLPLAKLYPYSIMCYTYTKVTLAMSMRMGWIMVSPLMPGKEAIREAVKHIQIVNWCFPNADVMDSLQALEEYRDDESRMEKLVKKRDRIKDILIGIGYRLAVQEEGTFYLYWKSPLEDDVLFAIWLCRRNVVVLPGSAFGTPGTFRMSLTATAEMIEKSADTFRICYQRAMDANSNRP